MPELPEVEVVRRGLEPHLVGKSFRDIDVRHPRAIRGIDGGAGQLIAALAGQTVQQVRRRGKFLWLELGNSTPDQPCLVVHLGMSGQMLIKDSDVQPTTHARICTTLDDGTQLWFVDQRTFGYWLPTTLVDVGTGVIPSTITHIARDLLDPELDVDKLSRRISAKNSEIKKLLLNQEIVAGIGNIYADEMLWAAQIHPRTPGSNLSKKKITHLMQAGQTVMRAALEQGGTSFDELYVNVNGESGYFDVRLNAYGQHNKPCDRCGTEIIKEKFTNRSSHFCPQCQRL